MSLVRTLLHENTDSSFIDDILTNASVKNSSELVELLKQGQAHWFSESLLLYMFPEYEPIVKDAVKSSYHPVIIKELQKYGMQEGIKHWNIGNYNFRTSDMVYDFFAPYNALHIEEETIKKLVSRSFSQDTMLLWSSFVYPQQDSIFFVFSTIKFFDPDKEEKPKREFVEKAIMSIERKWLDNISAYLQQKCSDFSLFDILKLDANKVL